MSMIYNLFVKFQVSESKVISQYEVITLLPYLQDLIQESFSWRTS